MPLLRPEAALSEESQNPGSSTAEPAAEVSAQQLRQLQISEFSAWLRTQTNKHDRPFQEETIRGYAETARALGLWMTEQEVDDDFTACDVKMLNEFFSAYRNSHSQGGTNTRQRAWPVAVAEFAIGIALVAGLFTRVAALGSLALLFTYVMSGTASVCAFYALFAIVILVMWRTSSWIGADGLIAGYRQRHPDLFTARLHLPGTRGTAGTAAAHPAA